MTRSDLQQAALDALVDPLGREYHYRIGVGGTRHHLPAGSLEVVLGASVAAFILPYLKRIAENAADATWRRLFDHSRSSTSNDEAADISILVISVSEANHREAIAYARACLEEVLQQHNFSVQAIGQAGNALEALVESLRAGDRQ